MKLRNVRRKQHRRWLHRMIDNGRKEKETYPPSTIRMYWLDISRQDYNARQYYRRLAREQKLRARRNQNSNTLSID
jgi:hypothetical protein